MPIPLIPVITALAAGGTLVPHAAGGLIVTSAAGYVVGTYLSTSAIAALVTAATATVGAGTLALTGAASGIIGGAGVFGTTIGATGITGVLMSAGILPATPVVVPIAIGGIAIGCAYLTFYLWRLRRKIMSATDGEELLFTEREAKVIEALVRRIAKKTPPPSTT